MTTLLQDLRSLLAQPAGRRPLLLFLLSAALALFVAFRVVTPAQTERLIVKGGYFYVLAVFAAWVIFAWRLMQARRGMCVSWVRRPGRVGLFLMAATGFAVWTDDFAHKVLFDEYVVQGTAWHMHLTKEIGAPLRAFDFSGTWMVIDTFLDKRPYFFPFLVSLLHDLTGFRLANVYVLNVAVAFALLGATYWLVRSLTARRGPALLAVALLASLPLFGQNATGASMELLNLGMIAAVMVGAVLYLRVPTDDRLSFLILGTVLLAQTRYESVLFVFPVAVIIATGWWRAGRILLPWPALLAPLMLVPYVWHDRFVSSRPVLWQLREGEVARFAWQYLAGNLEGARQFFFSTSPGQPNSLWLTIVGLLGLGWAAVHAVKFLRGRAAGNGRPSPDAIVVLLFGLTVAANLGLLMFYYWSRLDEPIAARFALPSYFFLAVLAGWWARTLDVRGWPATGIMAGGLAVWVLVFGFTAYAHRFYTSQNMVMHELNWEIEQAAKRPRPTLLITSKATLPFLMEKIPAVNTVLARVRLPQIAWHMKQGTFREVIVTQVIRPMSAQGDAIIDPEDEFPVSLHLETIAEKRFGGRWIRISRVTGIDLPPPTPSPAQ